MKSGIRGSVVFKHVLEPLEFTVNILEVLLGDVEVAVHFSGLLSQVVAEQPVVGLLQIKQSCQQAV